MEYEEQVEMQQFHLAEHYAVQSAASSMKIGLNRFETVNDAKNVNKNPSKSKGKFKMIYTGNA